MFTGHSLWEGRAFGGPFAGSRGRELGFVQLDAIECRHVARAEYDVGPAKLGAEVLAAGLAGFCELSGRGCCRVQFRGRTIVVMDRFAWAEAITAFARAIAAARSNDAGQDRAAAQKLDGYRATLVAAKQAYWAEQVDIQQRAAAAWAARAQCRNDAAIALMRAAADLEDSTEKHHVTPAPVVPARELLGEMLLELNQPAQALVEFEASATREPKRFNGLFGAARAAELSGSMAKARVLYAQLVALCGPADSERPELRHAKAARAK
jgi:hypothetical protein